MIKKLQIKFIAIVMIIVTILVSLSLSILIRSIRINFEHDSIATMRLLAENPKPHTIPKQDNYELRIPFFILNYDESNNLTESSGIFFDLSNTTLLQELIDEIMVSEGNSGIFKEYNLRYLHLPEKSMIFFSDITGEQKALGYLKKLSLIVFICLFIVFYILAVVLSKWILKPVKEAFDYQHQFVSDASHELRTPITIIITNAQMLQNTVSSEEITSLTDNINVTAHHMKKLVTELLDLARLDDGKYKQSFTDINLSHTIERATLPYDPFFFERSLTLDTQIEDSIHIKGNVLLIEQLISILLDNALNHAEKDSTVFISLSADSKKALIKVSNHGTTIPKEDLPNLFKRFYRAEKSRSSKNHYGLGLSIAHKIVSLHKGKIWCESKNNLTTFYIRINLSSHSL